METNTHVERFKEMCRNFGINPEKLPIEIYETIKQANDENTTHAIFSAVRFCDVDCARYVTNIAQTYSDFPYLSSLMAALRNYVHQKSDACITFKAISNVLGEIRNDFQELLKRYDESIRKIVTYRFVEYLCNTTYVLYTQQRGVRNIEEIINDVGVYLRENVIPTVMERLRKAATIEEINAILKPPLPEGSNVFGATV